MWSLRHAHLARESGSSRCAAPRRRGVAADHGARARRRGGPRRSSAGRARQRKPALRTALDALRSSGSGSGDVDKACLSRPPVYLSTRETWSSWAAVRVGHFVFLFWFVEGGQVYVKRSNFCEGGELAAEAYYRRVCAAKLNGLKWRVPVPCFPGLEVDGVLGGDGVEEPVDVDVDEVRGQVPRGRRGRPLDANAL